MLQYTAALQPPKLVTPEENNQQGWLEYESKKVDSVLGVRWADVFD